MMRPTCGYNLGPKKCDWPGVPVCWQFGLQDLPKCRFEPRAHLLQQSFLAHTRVSGPATTSVIATYHPLEVVQPPWCNWPGGAPGVFSALTPFAGLSVGAMSFVGLFTWGWAAPSAPL
jgi:hypothetical protein